MQLFKKCESLTIEVMLEVGFEQYITLVPSYKIKGEGVRNAYGGWYQLKKLYRQ